MWGKIADYPELNLDIFKNSTGRICAKCETERESQWLLAAMKTQFPDKCRNWRFPHKVWGINRRELYLIPYINNVDGNKMMWCSDPSWIRRNQYEVVLFKDLILPIDIGDICPSEFGIQFLLGNI